jgi:hypothetical protein
VVNGGFLFVSRHGADAPFFVEQSHGFRVVPHGKSFAEGVMRNTNENDDTTLWTIIECFRVGQVVGLGEEFNLSGGERQSDAHG